ncbi:MAG TPA: ATP-binding protein [Xanthobacteraceae bacterium]|nr:ATP-binding protein [Xanthobacteraceae bacterium]
MVEAAALAATARDLDAELDWFARLRDARFQRYFELAGLPELEPLPAPPDLGGSSYARYLAHLGIDAEERLALVLALVPHLRPRLFDVFHIRNTTFDRRFTEFGGVRGPEDGFHPTGETLAFLLGGENLEARLRVAALLGPQRTLAKRNVLTPAADDAMKAPLRLAAEALDAILWGETRGPEFGAAFPAQRLETELDWDDLVLHPGIRAQIGEIAAWIAHGPTLMDDWGMRRLLRPGYRSLFHGPPGTGKTMTATLIGKATGRPVYRIDLALMVSKYIGETEKNLARVFDGAQSRDWILFFDEADALFGRRGETRDAHDRYANQEVAFLLQRIETFDGIAILASNLRDNIDPAFARRFESIVHFPMPRTEERAQLWRRGLPRQARLAGDVDLDDIARAHALSGGAIMNAVRFAALAALTEGGRPITRAHLLHAIRREYGKEGRNG